jgi:septal ring factor EnvC (AmiA/AmiB activator)
MITLKQTLFAAALGLFAAAPAFACHGHERGGVPKHIAQRLDNQQHRIARGIRSGELTHREAKRLKHQQREIKQLVRRYQADGRFSNKELRNLDRRLDRASRQIKRLQRNDITRYVQLHERYRHADYARKL